MPGWSGSAASRRSRSSRVSAARACRSRRRGPAVVIERRRGELPCVGVAAGGGQYGGDLGDDRGPRPRLGRGAGGGDRIVEAQCPRQGDGAAAQQVRAPFVAGREQVAGDLQEGGLLVVRARGTGPVGGLERRDDTGGGAGSDAAWWYWIATSAALIRAPSALGDGQRRSRGRDAAEAAATGSAPGRRCAG